MIDYPIYLYGNTESPSLNDGALFHYTKFESLIKILESMTLRSSALCRMNDLNEANIANLDWNQDLLLMIEAEKYVKEQCSIISFSKNYITGPICVEGSNHPAMWAHYADNSNGVCIVLDRESLIENNRGQLMNLFYKMEPVSYSLHCAPKDGIEYKEYSNASDFVQRNYRELFFKKHVDWKYEDEERFFVEVPRIYLNIKGAIKYIVLGGRLKNNEHLMTQLVESFITPGTESYHCFNIHSFAQMMPTVDGYLTVDASSTIYRLLLKMSESSSLAKDYLDWHAAHFS